MKSTDRLASITRAQRNTLLSQSDWTVLVDAPLTPEKQQEWIDYRQLLRDVPQQEGFPRQVVFPTRPL